VVEVRPDAIVIPAAAVVKRPAGYVVYSVESLESTRVSQRLVRPGVSTGDVVEICEGLTPGTLVVVEGAHYLSDGAHVSAQETTGE